MEPKLIGLYSPAPQSGKSTLSDHLSVYHGFVQLKFAGALKAMIATLLIEAGVCRARDVSRYLEGDLKEVGIPALGKSPRQLMQTLGTEWGRSNHPDFWVRIALAKARAMEPTYGVVIDDVRFPNEFQAIREAGGILVRITRPGAAASNGHSSEGALEGYPFDVYLHNDRTLVEYLREASTKLLR